VTQAAALRQSQEIAARYRNATPEVAGAIRQAAARTGVDFAYLMEKASVESGFRTDVRAQTSSATGLFQFIDRTWLDMVERHGAKHGLAEEAGAVRRRPDGTPYVADPEARQRVLELRKDPRVASLMAAEYAQENREHLRRTVGGEIGSTELYMAHFLGPGGAERFIREMRLNPNGTAADLFPEAARANRGVFYRDGRPLTMAQVHERFDAKFQGALMTAGIAPAPPGAAMSLQVARANELFQAPGGPPALPVRSPIDGQSFFTVMMLAQLQNPLDGDKAPGSAALGGRSGRTGGPTPGGDDERARTLSIPTIGS
jgi:hypothetical protein